MKKVTPQEFIAAYNDCMEATKEHIRTFKGDPEKQKNCPHDFDSYIGDLLHGPCYCGDCGVRIA